MFVLTDHSRNRMLPDDSAEAEMDFIHKNHRMWIRNCELAPEPLFA